MSNAAKTIALPEDLQAFAEERVRAGEYSSVGEVTQEAFRLLQRRDERRSAVREDLAAVFGEMERGSYLEPSDDEFARAVHERALKHSAE
jgi:putative addiction module CopG family antidote